MTTSFFHSDTLSYLIVMGMFAMYAVLDGFALGIGILHCLIPNHQERSDLQSTIAPLWNGNEVWLITAGGFLFAAFPMAYATFCSAFYLPVMALLVGFILRGISLEVRNSLPASWWHRFCDIMFCGGSCTITFMFGVALGNLIQGIALDETAEYAGSVEDLITPFPLLVGFLSLSMFALHGAVYGLLTTEQPIHNTISKRIPLLLGFFFSTYALTVTSAIILYPHIASTVASRPCVWCVGTVNLASMASLFYAVTANHLVWAFGASCMTVVSSFALYASTTFPILIRSLEHSALKSLTIFNAASSPEALKILLLYAIIGIPIVIIYSSFVHWIFHRKDPSHT